MDEASHAGRRILSSRSLPSSDASRPKSGILTPSSTASLNHEPGSGMASRKRKRDSNPMGDLLKPTIVVKVCCVWCCRYKLSYSY